MAEEDAQETSIRLPDISQRDIVLGILILFAFIALPVYTYGSSTVDKGGFLGDLTATTKDTYCVDIERDFRQNTTSDVLCECYPADDISVERIPTERRVREGATLRAVLVCDIANELQIHPLWQAN